MPRRNSWQIGGSEELEKPSRSQKKRESAALQQTGERLARLSVAKRSLLPLPHDLKTALDEYPRLQGHETRRRQLQYIGRLMREANEAQELQPVLDALDLLD